MVAHLVSLKLRLFVNGLKRSTWILVGFIIGCLYGLFILGMLFVGLVALRWAEPELAGTVVVVGGSLTVLGWILVPLVARGVDSTLDPERFVTYAIPPATLIRGLAIGALVGIPGLVTLVLALGTVIPLGRDVPSVLATLVGAVLGVTMCVVLSRVVMTALSGLTNSRRFKDVSGIVAFIPLIFLGPIIFGVMAAGDTLAEVLPKAAKILEYTPLGAPWSIGPAVLERAWGQALICLVIALVSIGAGLWLWQVLLSRALTEPSHTSIGSRAGGKLGAFAAVDASPTRAVAARSLTYWLKDPRYGGSLITVPLIPLFMWFTAARGGDGTIMLFAAPIAALLIGFSISADISYDNTAFWLHVSSGITGRADRTGRVIACAIIAVPLIAILLVVGFAVSGRWDTAPAIVGLTGALFMTALGGSSIASARYVYPVPAPGDSPFKQPQGAGMLPMLIGFALMAAVVVLCVPVLILTIMSVAGDNAVLGWIALVVGLTQGIIAIVVGIRAGGSWFDKRTPELMQQVAAF